MKNISIVSGALASVCLLWGCKGDNSIVETVDGKKPNIIFILTDDQPWDALGFAGNDIIHTPHMDKLAEEGLYFENAFVTTAICAASRASIFTGLYERTHDFTFGKPPLNDGYMYESYPYLLREAGYRTGFVGKFGVKVNEGIEDAMFDYSEKTFWPYLRDIDGEEVHLADINGAPDQWRDGIFLEHRLEGNYELLKTDGYRDDTYKFIRYDDNPFIELYNHREDVHETENLAYEPEYSDKVDYYMNKCDSIADKLLSDRLHEN